MKATLKFKDVNSAKLFAKHWGRESLQGHDMSSVKPCGGVEVVVYDVTPGLKAWINDYVSNAADKISTTTKAKVGRKLKDEAPRKPACFHLSPNNIAKVSNYAKAAGVSRSQVINDLIARDIV